MISTTSCNRSGPAASAAAIQAAKFGKRAALVEKMEVIGGAAINTGTIPSKTMREAVLHLSGFYYQSIYGRETIAVKEQITMADLSFAHNMSFKTEIDVTRAQLSRKRHRSLERTGEFHQSQRYSRVCARGRRLSRR